MSQSRSPMFDGPLQRQIMLMKLIDLMKHRPIFGGNYSSNPDSEVNHWLARVGAIMARLGAVKHIEYKSALATSIQYWVPAINSVQRQIYGTIEDLKLELELYQEDDIGRVFQIGQKYEFLKSVFEITESAASQILVVDPYFDSASFTALFRVEVPRDIRILMSKQTEPVKHVATFYTSQTNTICEVRKSKDIHDRLLIIDNSDCWVIGASIKDGGKKPTYILPVPPEMASAKIAIYSDLWERSGAAMD